MRSKFKDRCKYCKSASYQTGDNWIVYECGTQFIGIDDYEHQTKVCHLQEELRNVKNSFQNELYKKRDVSAKLAKALKQRDYFLSLLESEYWLQPVPPAATVANFVGMTNDQYTHWKETKEVPDISDLKSYPSMPS